MITAAAERQLARVHRDVQPKLYEHMRGLATEPRPLGSKKMKGEYAGWYRISFGSYRIAFTIDEESRTVTIRLVGPRGKVY